MTKTITNNVAELPRYKCHKEVHALKIAEVQVIQPPVFQGVLCRGSKALGSGCGVCERCKYEEEHGPWRTKYFLAFAESGYARLELDCAWVNKHQPKPGGYYVVYEDGYTSFSPAQAFESGYTRI